MPFHIKTLKEFVDSSYPDNHPLRVILQEEDLIEDTREFLAKVEVWLKLSHQ